MLNKQNDEACIQEAQSSIILHFGPFGPIFNKHQSCLKRNKHFGIISEHLLHHKTSFKCH
jgi:hypothetical protein